MMMWSPNQASNTLPTHAKNQAPADLSLSNHSQDQTGTLPNIIIIIMNLHYHQHHHNNHDKNITIHFLPPQNTTKVQETSITTNKYFVHNMQETPSHNANNQMRQLSCQHACLIFRSRLKSWPTDQLSWLRFPLVFLSLPPAKGTIIL